ncbi:MAG: SIMPL domain-containing protein [Prevotellaceae bacterium]|jgi:uncharacterized protein YggE|nr:SIMPL domain-containing protein [Prevotellaceae bacterium]
MKKALFFAAALLLAASAKAQSGEKNFIDQPYIEVVGRAEKEVTPDEIYLKIIINENDNKAKKPLERLEKDMIAALSQLGVDVAKELAVKDLWSAFKLYWYKRSDIFAAKEYQLLVHSAAVAGKVLQELEKLGVSNISISRVDHSEIEKFRREVKVSAMKDAQSKAADLLQAIGQRAGRALWVQEVDRTPYRAAFASPARTMKASSLANDEAAALPEAEFEKIKLEYTVMARFAIEP